MVSYKIGVCKVSPKGKDCSTVFKRLGFNTRTNTSVVLCRPKTGRMHQIRVHLQYLGRWCNYCKKNVIIKNLFFALSCDPFKRHPLYLD